MKRIFNIIIFIALASGMVFLFVFANLKQKELVCSEFIIDIDYNGAPPLINNSTIRREITNSGIRIKNQLITSIKAPQLQQLLKKNPYVKKATITVSVNGIVKANILQRNPLVRVVDQEYNQCLLDDEGLIMPVSNEFPVRLVLANGNIENVKKATSKKGANNTQSSRERYRPKAPLHLPSDLSNIYLTALKLKTDSLTSALIEQIYINNNKEIELIPKVGEQSIIMGDTVLIDHKLKNLRTFYNYGMKNFAWNNYKVINLKYENQVVCSK
jgi:cell division protein FtsQ